jgi:ornithine carbamoyltransferase
MIRHFLEVDDLSPSELIAVLDASEASARPLLTGRGVGLIFEKPSLRTRNSAEMAVVQLGGHPVFITDAEAGLDKRESVEDITRVIEGYFAVIAARVFEHGKLERMASVAKVPIINLLSDDGHPVQALADLLTIRQHFGDLANRTIGWVGDFSNVARSLSIGAMLCGMHMRVATPAGYGPSRADIDRFAALAEKGATFTVVDGALKAASGADVVSTDAWYSMGQEDEHAIRADAMRPYRVDSAMMSQATPDAIFLHCLPAHRGEEVTSEVLDSPQSRAFPQAHNRMHTFRGLLSWLCA